MGYFNPLPFLKQCKMQIFGRFKSRFEQQYVSCSKTRAGARTLIGGGGGVHIHISGYARLISFEINIITKETSRAEPEYMNIHLPPSLLAF